MRNINILLTQIIYKEVYFDHIYPVIEGWKNKIDPKLISNYKNLQLINSYENLSKSARTNMSSEDFFNLIS